MTLNSFTPGVSIVTREAGLTVRPLSVVCAVALAGVVVTVPLQRVAMAVTLTRHTATTPSQGRTEAPGTTVLTMRPGRPVWKRKGVNIKEAVMPKVTSTEEVKAAPWHSSQIPGAVIQVEWKLQPQSTSHSTPLRTSVAGSDVQPREHSHSNRGLPLHWPSRHSL